MNSLPPGADAGRWSGYNERRREIRGVCCRLRRGSTIGFETGLRGELLWIAAGRQAGETASE